MTRHNALGPTTVSEASREYLRRGWVPVSLRPRDKVPIFKDYLQSWPTEDDLVEMFPPQHSNNVGVLTGNPNQLVDVDLDCLETVQIESDRPQFAVGFDYPR